MAQGTGSNGRSRDRSSSSRGSTSRGSTGGRRDDRGSSGGRRDDRGSSGGRSGSTSRGDSSRGGRRDDRDPQRGRDDRRPQRGRGGRADESRGRPARLDSSDRPTRSEPTGPPDAPEIWIDEGRSDVGAGRKKRKAPQRSSAQRVQVEAPELAQYVSAKRVETLQRRLGDAAGAFAGERYGEARSLLAPIVREVPDLAVGRELYGLTLYRLGRWKEAASQLDAFVKLSPGSTEQHPVLADCRRALGQYKEVDRLWEELREVSPSPELMNEGRIVVSGSLADQGDLAGAITLLQKGFRIPKRPAEHHLRRAYALADLYERAGDMPQARMLFERLETLEPGYLDAAERAESLS